ncbi:cytochrome P450 [Bradyrhizobium jicamae]|uniref:cytochrome P450 n=1 Tax=Bradyrhizobium jicamae TaxID=280332 RepID=UPI001BA64D40|nr:cytochrome P450 [Bradyrhizobium jicamae]MBR0755273.1 cytochrome P450 [Bradyrhizobium jicamae]
MTTAPSSAVDPFATETLLDPFPTYRQLRDQGPAVWLKACGMFALPRYAEVRGALEDWQLFSSAGGVSMNDEMNQKLKGGLLCSDPPNHNVLRKVIERPLTPRALSVLRERVTTEAENLVERLVAKGTFDVATELSPYLPVSIVSELVGLPEEGRERMLEWAPANFDCFGPINERTKAAFPIVGEMIHYAFNQCVPGKLKPGGWAQMIWDAADRGEIDPAICPFLMNDYMGPSLDTTIFATTSAIWLFAQNPDQWAIVRDNPSLLPQAVNEAIRIESPIQAFSRYVTRDHEIDGVTLPAGSRAILLFGSANRDERKWEDPEGFRVMRRETNEHLGFGFGEHQCVGNNLARMEIRALLVALTKRVKGFELHEMERGVNNVLRGIKKCVVSVH